MHSSDLVNTVQKLSKKDFRQLKKMVESPYFNQRQDVMLLFEYMKQAVLSKKKTVFDRHNIFKAIFPKEKFDVQKLRYTMSFLHKIIQQYFVLNELDNDSILTDLHLCKALRKRGMATHFQKELKALKLKKKHQELNNTLSHYQNYRIALENHEFTSAYSRETDMDLEILTSELSRFYFADLLKLSCFKLSAKNTYKNDFDFTLVESLLPIIEQHGLLDNIATEIYFHSYKALQDDANVDDFKKVKTLIARHWNEFSTEEAKDIYTIGINFCIRKLDSGEKEYIREAFELYKSGFKHHLFYENGGLSSFQYKNVVRLGIGLGELDWVADFMETQAPFLFPTERENTYRYNQAYFHFHKKEYDKALELLQKIEYKEVLQNLDARRMILCIYYERNEFEPLYSLLKSFSTYIRRHKNEIGYYSQNYLNLIKFITKMINANMNDKKIVQQIKQEVQATSNVAEKAWLISMLEV